jgi:hypothetical protein
MSKIIAGSKGIYIRICFNKKNLNYDIVHEPEKHCFKDPPAKISFMMIHIK